MVGISNLGSAIDYVAFLVLNILMLEAFALGVVGYHTGLSSKIFEQTFPATLTRQGYKARKDHSRIIQE